MIVWMHMVDAQRGYAVEGIDPAYHLVATADAGRTWKQLTPVRPNGTATIAGKTIVFGTQLGARTFAVERSDDGGRTWRMSQPFRDSHTGGIGAPDLVDSQHLYVAIGEGAAAGSEAESLWRSDDGGRTWRFVSRTGFTVTKPGQLPFGCDKNGYGFATPARGWATGFCPGGAPFVYRTDDGGRTWRRISLPGVPACACEVTVPEFFGPRVGVMTVRGFGDGGNVRSLVSRVYWTRDGGASWRGVSVPTRGGRGDGPLGIADARTVWVAATRPGNLGLPFDRLFRTADAGRSWASATLPFDFRNYQLDALDGTTAFAYAGRTILTTTDGGRHWRGLPRGSSCPLQLPNTLHGSSVALVRPGATSVALCRYSPRAGRLVASARVTGATAVRLTNELDALPKLAAGIHCPFDDGSAILAMFRYAHAAPNPVRIGLRGCNAATNGRITLRATPLVLGQLERIVEPAKPTKPCTDAQLGVSVQTQGENTTTWIGVTVANRGTACIARNVPVTVAVEGKRLTLHASGGLYHGGTQLLVANWSNWCGSTLDVRVVVEAGSAVESAPVRPLPACLQRGRPSRLFASRSASR